MINCCSCRGGEVVEIKAWIYQKWVIGVRANNNKKAVLSVLTKTFFSLMLSASRGVLRLSPWLIKPREERTHAGHRCMSWGDQQSFIRGGSAQRSHSFLPFFDRKGTPLVYLLLPTNGTRFTYVTREDSWPSLELCIPLNCCKCTVFDIWISHKTKKFWRLFHG